MPELPEVETVARDLQRRVTGWRVTSVWASSQALRGQQHVDLPALTRSVGATIDRVRRRAKYLLLELSTTEVWLFHLGMTGNLYVALPGSERAEHTHLVFGLAPASGGPVELRFVDPRRFGLCRVLLAGAVAGAPELQHLGPEPLGDGFSVDALAAALHGSRRESRCCSSTRPASLASATSMPRRRCGSQVSTPRTRGGRIGPERRRRLHAAIRQVLLEAIANRGTTFRELADPQGRPGEHLKALTVYGREGEACARCGAPVRSIVQAQRSTFFCGRCQHV